MSHQAFDKLLEQLRERCLGMAGMVQQTVALTTDGIVKLDVPTAKKVLEGEQRIDDEDVQIEKQAINLLILHHPAAQDFRTVFGIVKINSDLERIGDCAVNIAQQVPRIIQAGVDIPRDVRLIAEAALKQVQDTVRCISTRDPDLAEEICRADDVVDALNSQILQDMQAEMEAERDGVPGRVGLIMVAKNFERIGDHCNNIAEDVLFLMKGEIVRHAHEK